MKIAVIVPHRHAGATLDRCLRSIDDQFYPVVVDDDVLKKGVSGARNVGLEIAIEEGCDYVTFLDADDAHAQGAFYAMRREINRFPQAGIIQFNHIRQYADGSEKRRFWNSEGIRVPPQMPDFWMPVWNKVFKMEVVEDVLFDENLSHGEDELFVLECLKKAGSIECSELATVVHYCDTPGSLSKTKTEDDLWKEVEALESFIKRTENPGLRQAVMMRLSDQWKGTKYMKLLCHKE